MRKDVVGVSLVLCASFWLPLCAGAQRADDPGIDRRALFVAVGGMYDLDPALLAAIAAVESDDRSSVVSPAGAIGLMQLMPATAARFGVSNPFDPVQSALGAARFIAYLKSREGLAEASDLPSLLAAYNAGEKVVERNHGVPPYPETVRYVRRVLWRYLLSRPLPPRSELAMQASPAGNRDAARLEQLADLRHARLRAQESWAGEREFAGGKR